MRAVELRSVLADGSYRADSTEIAAVGYLSRLAYVLAVRIARLIFAPGDESRSADSPLIVVLL